MKYQVFADIDGKYVKVCQIEAPTTSAAYSILLAMNIRAEDTWYSIAPMYCGKCGWKKNLDAEEVDHCIGRYLPGVAHACCGHGEDNLAYAVGWPGCNPGESCITGKERPGFWKLEGEDAIKFFKSKGAKI